MSNATQELIARLETATGPDRELGNDVLFACGWTTREYGGGPSRSTVWAAPNGEEFLDADQPDPTASIDAAQTLVPEGWEWTVDGGNAAMGDSPSANVWPQQQPFLAEHDMFVVHASAAIALCIAALKAREVEQ